MQIKDLPSSNTLASTDVLAKDTSGGTTEKISGSDLAGQIKALGGLLGTSDVVNNLTGTATDKPLSAAQGKALNDHIATKVGSVTAENNITSYSEIRKTGNIVSAFLSIWFGSEVLTANTETKLGTIESGFRPSYATGGAGINSNSGVQNHIPVYISINTNGEIIVMANSTVQGGCILANITYVLS